ncbi:MAG: hypothetical protein HOQ03_14370 [Thermoleophilia bacterium]|nr:hypothetical protein [Thermoleophilia bacterium]
MYADQELAVFRRSLDLTHTAPPADVVEGVVVKHAGAALGSAPKHAGDADVRAALDALHPLKLALMTDEADITAPDEANASMRGLVVDPRGDGRVAVYWVEAGIYVDEQRRPHGTELRIIADKLREAGWRVEDGAVRCVFAWRPIDDAQAPEDGFAVGSFVVCADGRTRRITGTASHLGEPARIVDEDGAEWVADNCRPIKVARVRRRPAPEDVARIRAQARADRTAYEVESVARRAADVKRYGDAPREGADG